MATGIIKHNELDIINKLLDPTLTNDAMADSVNNSYVATFRGSGGSYTGTLPHGDYAYGVFLSIPRLAQRTLLAIYHGRGIAINLYNNGAWEGWHTINLDS